MAVTKRKKTKLRVSMADSVNTKNRISKPANNDRDTKCTDIIQIICYHFDTFQKLQEDTSLLSGKQKVKVTSNAISNDGNDTKKYAMALRDELSTFQVIHDLNKVYLEHGDAEKCQNSLAPKEHSQNMIIQALFHVIYANLSCSAKDHKGKISTRKSVENFDYARDQTWSLLAFFLQVLGQEEVYQRITEKLIQLSKCMNIEDVRGQCVIALGHLSTVPTSSDNSSVIEALITRLQDKNQTVRLLAVQACGQWCQHYVQKSIGHNLMIDSLILVMERDSSPAIRLAVIHNLKCISSPDHKLLTSVMHRVHDTKVKVRIEAVNFLKVHSREVLEIMSAEDCSLILKYGLTERCPQTFEATSKMLCCGWLKATKFDPLKLLSRLEPTYNEEICEQAARAIVNATENKSILNELSKPEIEAFSEEVLNLGHFDKMWKMTKENAQIDIDTSNTGINTTNILFLRIHCETVQKMKDTKAAETELSKLLPDIPDICNALKLHLEKLNNCVTEGSDDLDDDNTSDQDMESSICLQILKLVQLCDLKEEGSRRYLTSLLQSVLVMLSTPDDILEKCVLTLLAAHDTEAQFIQTISEVLADMNDIKDTDDELDNAENETNVKTPEAESIHLAKRIRTIAIVSIVLENISTRMSSSTVLKTIASTYIEPAITHSDAMVREAGVSCLGKFTILMIQDPAILKETKCLLLNVATNEDERMATRAQAVLALTDLSLMHDSVLSPETLMVASIGENENKTANIQTRRVRGRSLRSTTNQDSYEKEGKREKSICLASILREMLSQPHHPALCTIAAECSAKLMFSGKVHDACSLSRLIVMYFDRDYNLNEHEDEDDATDIGSPVRLQQLLTLFFPAYCMKFKVGRETMMSSIKPMLETIHEKMNKRVRGRRAFVWPIIKMIEYICNIVEEGEERYEERKESLIQSKTDVRENGKVDEIEENNVEENEMEDVEPSPVLLLAIAVADFIVDRGADLPVTFLRTLCKILRGVNLELESESIQYLNVLMKKMDELSIVITDAPSLRSLENLFDLLSEEIPIDEEVLENQNSESDTNDNLTKRDSLDSKQSETSKISNTSCVSVAHAFQAATLNEGKIQQSLDNFNVIHDGTQNHENEAFEDDFFEENQGSSQQLSEDEKENSIQRLLSNTFTPKRKKCKSSEKSMTRQTLSSKVNKRKTYTPIKSATKPRATKKGLYYHNSSD